MNIENGCYCDAEILLNISALIEKYDDLNLSELYDANMNDYIVDWTVKQKSDLSPQNNVDIYVAILMNKNG